MLPLVILTSQHQCLLHPHTTLRQFPARLDQRAAKVHAFGVGVEDIDARAFLCNRGQVLVGLQQELIKRPVGHVIVLDLQLVLGRALVVHVVRCVDHDQIGPGTRKHPLDIGQHQRIAA